MAKVILYDLPSQPPCKSWSLNAWKTRMVLNYKSVDYKTEWIEYPDIAPTFKAFGLSPNDSNGPGYFMDYSCPTIRYQDDTVSMDSWKIVYELEKRYPTPSLHLDDPIVVKIRDQISKLLIPLFPHIIPKVPRVLLNNASVGYFEQTRKEMLGMTLNQFQKEQANEQCWVEVKEPAKETADLLQKNGGPYFLGATISYADFILVSFLQFLRRTDEQIYQQFLDLDPSFGKLYEASKQWLVKDA